MAEIVLSILRAFWPSFLCPVSFTLSDARLLSGLLAEYLSYVNLVAPYSEFVLYTERLGFT